MTNSNERLRQLLAQLASGENRAQTFEQARALYYAGHISEAQHASFLRAWDGKPALTRKPAQPSIEYTLIVMENGAELVRYDCPTLRSLASAVESLADHHEHGAIPYGPVTLTIINRGAGA